MPIHRIIVDLNVNDELDIDELSSDVGRFVFGVITEKHADGEGKVDYNAGSHLHRSTDRYNCEECASLAYDGVH